MPALLEFAVVPAGSEIDWDAEPWLSAKKETDVATLGDLRLLRCFVLHGGRGAGELKATFLQPIQESGRPLAILTQSPEPYDRTNRAVLGGGGGWAVVVHHDGTIDTFMQNPDAYVAKHDVVGQCV